MKRQFLFLHLLLISFFSFGDKTKQALRALEKGDFEKVEEILLKSQEKDTVNPATEYVWALLFTDTAYVNYNLDSAHLFIQLACTHFALSNEEHLDELEDAEVTEYDLRNKKITIDSIAFARAEDIHTIDGYQMFIDIYESAKQVTMAASLQTHLVFLEVKALHNWRAYKQFMQDYPASPDIEKAKISYDKLIFEERTHSGQIPDLEQFLFEEPNTPYRHRLEKVIFQNKIAQLNPKSIESFIKAYHNSRLIKRSLGILYHLEDYQCNIK